MVTGGQSCGKSTFAQKTAEKIIGKRAYIATAQAFDEEMKIKIQRHIDEREDRFDTIEEPLELDKAILKTKEYDVVLLDCLTMWTSNIILNNENTEETAVEKYLENFIKSLEELKNESKIQKIIVVTNEVGWGIIPGNKISRIYARLLGNVNKKIAKIADEVYMMVSGIEVKIK
jgi:adenosylcobinamide kinase/adenosylcobinamide-phosphate guanylyltransferase